jgi:hypothetical protein
MEDPLREDLPELVALALREGDDPRPDVGGFPRAGR